MHPQTAHQATYIVFHEICKAPTMILTVHHHLQAISYHSVEVYKATRVIIVIHTTQATAHVQNLFPGFVNVNSFVLRNAVEMLLMIKNYIVHVTHKSQYHLKHKNFSAVPVHLIATLTAWANHHPLMNKMLMTNPHPTLSTKNQNHSTNYNKTARIASLQKKQHQII